MPISTGEQLIGSALFGALYFQEWAHTWQYILGFGALAVIIFGIYLTTYNRDRPENDGTNIRGGLIVLTLSALGSVGYAVLPRIFGLNGWDILLPQAISILVSMAFIVGSINPHDIFSKKSFQNIPTGFCFAVANIGIMLSNQLNGVAVGFTLSQLNVVVATLGGLFILHERKTKKQKRYILVGLVVVVVGAVMIGVTKQR